MVTPGGDEQVTACRYRSACICEGKSILNPYKNYTSVNPLQLDYNSSTVFLVQYDIFDVQVFPHERFDHYQQFIQATDAVTSRECQ